MPAEGRALGQSSSSRRLRAGYQTNYWTVRVRLRFWLREPDVPVSVSVEVPSGVPGLPLLPELLFPPQPTTNETLKNKRVVAHNRGTRQLERLRRFPRARIRNTSKRKAMGQIGMRVLGMRHRPAGTAEAAVVLTVTLKGTGEFALTSTGFGGLHVARAGAPEHVKLTVPVKPPIGLIWRL